MKIKTNVKAGTGNIICRSATCPPTKQPPISPVSPVSPVSPFR